ncbi:MAG TPA: dual specificity protein phosphatase [Acidobacteriota bacterium]|jgi:protein-tyrosine phosphatase
MDLIQIDDKGLLFVAPEIDDWDLIAERQIKVVIDLDGEVDLGVPSVPDGLLYLYFPIYDENLPDLVRLHGLGRFAAEMVQQKRAVLAHCCMGLNRSPLMAGVILTYLGMSGAEAMGLLREKRPGALFNERFARYLASLRPDGNAGRVPKAPMQSTNKSGRQNKSKAGDARRGARTQN